ncbi:MAG: glycosyltransferase family 39 protein [Candidatus Latescibacteria bacterium]|nr:glycosyltransferase family 39 protein [Candidatus Latescibacterota bacterium]
MRALLKTWKTDPWLWGILLLGLALRLIELQAPLIDGQAWRQADSGAIARNFYQEGYDLFHPRVDWRGTTPGFVEMNFPLYSFLVACLYGLLGGVHEWAGRLFSGLCSTAAAGLLYLLVGEWGGGRWARRLAALLFLIFPLNVFYGRAFMPESLMLLLSVGTLLAFSRWTRTGAGRDFALAALAGGLCFMVKIPTLYLGFPLVALAWARWGWGFLRRPELWGYLVLVLTPPALWYWHAHQLFLQTGLTFGIWGSQGYDKWAQGLLATSDFYLELLRRFGHQIFTPVGVVLVLVGLRPRWQTRQEAVLYAWAGALLLYLVLIPEGNYRLVYYQVPFVPLGAVLAARGLAPLLDGGSDRRRQAMAGGVVVLLAGYGAWAAPELYRPPNNVYNYYRACHAVGQIIDQKLPATVLLLVGDIDENAAAPCRAQSPTMLYYCRRKGWQITPSEFTAATLDSLAARGAAFLVVAAGFAMQDRVFWDELLRRGVSVPAAYPRAWHDPAEYRRMLAGYQGPDRDFVLVQLAPPR